MKLKSFMDWVDANPDVREKYASSSNTCAHYLIEYCEWRANALRDLGIEDDVIDHLMEESWATNREFFEEQDSVVLCRLCSYDWLRDFLTEKMDEVYDVEYEKLVNEMVEEIEDYAEREMIVINSNDSQELLKLVTDYLDKKDFSIPGNYTYTEFVDDIVDNIY